MNFVAIVHQLEFLEQRARNMSRVLRVGKIVSLQNFHVFRVFFVATVVFHGSLIQKSPMCRPLSSPRFVLCSKDW